MILAAICSYALSQQQAPPRREGPTGPVLLAIYRLKLEDLNGMAGATPDDVHGKSMRYDRLGAVSWKILDGGIKGVPCKIYTGHCNWRYTNSVRNTAIKEYHEVTLKMVYHVTLDGIPLHSESHFVDSSERKLKTIDVVADYATDHIDETITKDGYSEKLSLYPTFGMERFAGMFEPMMRSGLIQAPEMECAVLHPYSGVPYEFKLKVRSRFTGSYFFLPQAGYCIDVDGKEGVATAFLTRQGQLIRMQCPNMVEAVMEEGPLAPERHGWGTFSIADWDKATDQTNPERPIYHTGVIPVYFQNPKVLFPVPCALTD